MKPWREAVRVVLRRDNNIVLVRHEEFGNFTLPGGGVEEGESLYEATNRELFEELGLSTNDFRIDFVSPHKHFYEYPDKDRAHRGQEETIVLATLHDHAQLVPDEEEVFIVALKPVSDIPYEELLEAVNLALAASRNT